MKTKLKLKLIVAALLTCSFIGLSSNNNIEAIRVEASTSLDQTFPEYTEITLDGSVNTNVRNNWVNLSVKSTQKTAATIDFVVKNNFSINTIGNGGGYSALSIRNYSSQVITFNFYIYGSFSSVAETSYWGGLAIGDDHGNVCGPVNLNFYLMTAGSSLYLSSSGSCGFYSRKANNYTLMLHRYNASASFEHVDLKTKYFLGPNTQYTNSITESTSYNLVASTTTISEATSTLCQYKKYEVTKESISNNVIRTKPLNGLYTEHATAHRFETEVNSSNSFIYEDYDIAYCEVCGETISKTKTTSHECIEETVFEQIGTSCVYEIYQNIVDPLTEQIYKHTKTGETIIHEYGEPVYEWNEENSQCTATRICKNDPNHIETETANAMYEITQEADCTHDELATFTVEFENPAFETQIKENVLMWERIGHDYSAPIYTWNEENSQCTATRICKNDPNHIETETFYSDAVVTQEKDCTHDELTTYTVQFENPAFETQMKTDVLTAEKKGHNEASYIETRLNQTNDMVYNDYKVTYCTDCDEILKEEIVKTHYCETRIEARKLPEEPKKIYKYLVTFCSTCEEMEVFRETLIEVIDIKEMAPENIVDVEDPTDLLPETIVVEEDSKIADQLAEVIQNNAEQAVEIIASVSEASNELNSLLDSGDIDEETYEQMKESLQAITETTIEIAASKDGAVEDVVNKLADLGVAEVETSVPVIDVGQEIADFYQRQLDAILGKSSPSQGKRYSRGGLREEAQATTSQLDLTISADTYRQAIQFIDYSVGCMTEAATLIRECSNEETVTHINQIITGISCKLFRDFDQEAADAEFLENVSKAILLNIQQSVLTSLDEAYAQAKQQSNYYGDTKKAVDEEYEKNVADTLDLEVFEAYVIETMRLKFVYIIDNKLEEDPSYQETYNQLIQCAEDWETFEPTYRDIFAIWALNKENKPEYEGITMEVLCNTIIEEKTANLHTKNAKPTSLTTVDIILVSSLSAITLGGVVSYFLLKNLKRKELN